MKATSRNLGSFAGSLPDPPPDRGVLLYDGQCSRCAGLAARFRWFLARRGVRIAPIQSPWALALLQSKRLDPLAEMRLLTPGGALFGGADAILELARFNWWMRPLRWLARLPGFKPLLRKIYHSIARRRHCRNGICGFNRAGINGAHA